MNKKKKKNGSSFTGNNGITSVPLVESRCEVPISK